MGIQCFKHDVGYYNSGLLNTETVSDFVPLPGIEPGLPR